MRALEKLRSFMHRHQQSPRIPNIQRNGDWNQRDAVPQFAHTVAAAQAHGDHHPQQSSLDALSMQLLVAPDGRRDQRENDVVHAGPAGLPYGFDVLQWNIAPRDLLWS